MHSKTFSQHCLYYAMYSGGDMSRTAICLSWCIALFGDVDAPCTICGLCGDESPDGVSRSSLLPSVRVDLSVEDSRIENGTATSIQADT